MEDLGVKGPSLDGDECGDDGGGDGGRGFSDVLLWETPAFVSLDDLIVPSDGACALWAMDVPPLPKAQVRHMSSRDRRKKRKPMTPVVSKVKKTKMKFYSHVQPLSSADNYLILLCMGQSLLYDGVNGLCLCRLSDPTSRDSDQWMMEISDGGRKANAIMRISRNVLDRWRNKWLEIFFYLRCLSSSVLRD